jgi:GNAT superfamily N-acetyltransferase
VTVPVTPLLPPGVRLRPAIPADATAMAALMRSFDPILISDPAAAGPYRDGTSAAAHGAHIAGTRLHYLVAEDGEGLAGFISLRDDGHLAHLFVHARRHRQGLARGLWQGLLAELVPRIGVSPRTVNASPAAVPVYTRFGFCAVGEAIQQHGVVFVPMRRAEAA